MDFLSWMQHTGQQKPVMPVLVLNSVGLRKRAVEAIQAMADVKNRSLVRRSG